MTAIIITANLQKGSNNKNRIKLKDSFIQWFTTPEVQLSPERIMIIAGNLQSSKTHQTTALFKLIRQTMLECNMNNLKILWIRGNRDYWCGNKSNFQLHMREQESISLLERDPIFKNFHHISNGNGLITNSGILITGFDDWYDEIPLLSSDPQFIPQKIKNMKSHKWLLQYKEKNMLQCLRQLKDSKRYSKIKKRIVVSHFPHNEYPVDDENPFICNNDLTPEIEKLTDAWIYGNGSFCHETLDNITFMNPGSTTCQPHAIILKL